MSRTWDTAHASCESDVLATRCHHSALVPALRQCNQIGIRPVLIVLLRLCWDVCRSG